MLLRSWAAKKRSFAGKPMSSPIKIPNNGQRLFLGHISLNTTPAQQTPPLPRYPRQQQRRANKFKSRKR